mmetsp:Transcript_44333/g.75443  ORF Transcript_44333/g.75443 Transcript_44333/m.75443 type:complete len:209 (-) Transcript_44333:156-782(-)
MVVDTWLHNRVGFQAGLSPPGRAATAKATAERLVGSFPLAAVPARSNSACALARSGFKCAEFGRVVPATPAAPPTSSEDCSCCCFLLVFCLPCFPCFFSPWWFGWCRRNKVSPFRRNRVSPFRRNNVSPFFARSATRFCMSYSPLFPAVLFAVAAAAVAPKPPSRSTPPSAFSARASPWAESCRCRRCLSNSGSPICRYCCRCLPSMG